MSKNMKKFFALIAVLIVTMAAWAQTSVSTDSAFRSAIANGANIIVTGGLTGSSIGVWMESNTGTFTSGYSSHNGYDPATIFTSDLPLVMSVSLIDNEAKMDYLTSFQYIECSWDDVNKQVVKTPKTLSNQINWTDSPLYDTDYKVVTGGSGELGLGGKTNLRPEIFVVRGTVNRDALRVNGTNVHLILCDGATLNVNSVIVNATYKLCIHSQSYGASMGKLNADNNGHDENSLGYKQMSSGDELVFCIPMLAKSVKYLRISGYDDSGSTIFTTPPKMIENPFDVARNIMYTIPTINIE